MNYDIFISHATEDKDDFVRPLALALIEKGWKVWYDELSLEVGDSLRKSIDDGLKNSKFGVVVLSENFLKKKWTDYELNGFTTKAMTSDEKSILPIWHKLSHAEVAAYSLPLADLVALNSSMPMEYLVAKLAKVIGNPRTLLHPFPDGPWMKEPCPKCGRDANHVGYEHTSPEGAYDVDWIECPHCGFQSEKNYIQIA